MSMMKNKKGIGFGRLLVIVVLVVLGLSLWIMTISIPKVENSIGTDSKNSIKDINPKSYFQDAMRLSLSKSFKDLADSSFINKDNSACLLYGTSIILDDNCKPDTEYIKYTVSKATSTYIQEHLKKYLNEDIPVSCNIEQNTLTCISQEIEINKSKSGPYFSYSAERFLKLESSIDLADYGLDETQRVYEMAKECASTSSCTITSKTWELESFEEQSNFLVFSLRTKADYPQDDGSAPIVWVFSMRK
jgi:hypothetical protein